MIKAMTFNIRVTNPFDIGNPWSKRKKLVVDRLASHGADVIGLQEVLNSQLKYIKKSLPGYSTYSAGRSNGKTKGEACPILYRTDRFTMLDSGTFWFSKTPDKPSTRFGNFCPRICSWVQLQDKNTGTGLYIYNLHLDNLSQSSRGKSVRQLAKHIAARKTSEPFIVMGDFNMTLENPAMRYLQQIPDLQMTDAWLSVNSGKSNIGTRHNFSGKTNGPKIDHIPISKNVQALEVDIDQTDVNGKYPSDHYPVIAKILLKKPMARMKKRNDIFPELQGYRLKTLRTF